MEEKLIKLTIDNHEVEVPQGTTLLEAGKLVGIGGKHIGQSHRPQIARTVG